MPHPAMSTCLYAGISTDTQAALRHILALGLGHSTHQHLRPGHNTIVPLDYYMQMTLVLEGRLLVYQRSAILN